MMWAALSESATDLFMHAPIEEVTRHLSREIGDAKGSETYGDRHTGFPSAFSFDPTTIARPLLMSRGSFY
jgi:hypothetical protein